MDRTLSWGLIPVMRERVVGGGRATLTERAQGHHAQRERAGLVLGPATASPAVAPVAFHQPPRDLSRVAVRTCPISGLESHR